MTYRNPVIPGFHPDPSICRVGEDYYLATSSFEYSPGVPLFHSRDLVHWRPIGHCLTRPSQLPLEGVPSSNGIFAPSLRFHEGRFYMVTTNVSGGGHFYVHSDDPAGEWSDPIRVEGKGFDPDIFTAPDGGTYFIHQQWGHGIRIWRLDLATGELSGDGHTIWPGFEDRRCEAPHIYCIDGTYYLLVAEGGTHRGHMVVAARSEDVNGPYEGCPRNPILSHRARVELPIQATGHADLTQAHDGSWWMVFLGIRPVWGTHHLGRETFLAPVTWDEDGWPVVNGGRPIEPEMDADCLPPHPWPPEPVRDDFDEADLRHCWNFRRNPDPDLWSLTERPGHLRLHGSATTLDDVGAPAFVGRRQRHFDCRAETLLEFEPRRDGDEAGLTALMNERHHYEIALTRRGGERRIIVRRCIGDLQKVVADRPAGTGPLRLQIRAEPRTYAFGCAQAGGPIETLVEGAARYLSTEVAAGFTGVYFAMYATGNGRPCGAPADFDWFEYEPSEE